MTPRRRVLNGRYELDELPIGKSGMGEVWLGRDTKLGRRVAVKLIRFPDDQPDEELVQRFVRESRITARLEHPGVPAVYDVGTDQGRPFMVMQRIEGISGADLIAEHGALPSADVVYHRLVPFANELIALPGVLTPPSVPSPVRMYASVVGRILADSAVAVPPAQADHAVFSRRDLLRARTEARSLARSSQYERAAEVLAAAAQQATLVLRSDDPVLLSMRFELANLLFDGGEYARGAQEFGALAADLAQRDGPDDSVVLQCRRQEATCNAMLGRVEDALAQLRALLVDESRWLGPDHERVFELRKQIGLLELGGHRPEQARNTLEALVRDLERVGNQNAIIDEVRTLIEGLPK